MRNIKIMLFVLMLALFVSGCAKKAAPFKVYWPPPPAEPRYEWIVTYYSEDNFAKTDNELLTESVIGKRELHFFAKPQGVVSDGAGTVYVVDMDTQNVRMVDFNKKEMTFFSKEPIAQLPVGITRDANGRFYISDGGKAQVIVYDANRTPLMLIGDRRLLGKPTYMAVNDRLGRLYVSDVKKNQVVVFDLEGNHLFSFGEPGGNPGQLYGPQGIAIDAKDRVFVAEQFNARVQVFDADGKPLDYFGSRGDQEFQFEGPRGLAFDSDGHLYVAESRKAALLVFQSDGQPLTSIGGQRTLHQLGFTLPVDVTVDANDRIYVTDSLGRRMAVWQYLSKAYLEKNPLNSEALENIENKVRRLTD